MRVSASALASASGFGGLWQQADFRWLWSADLVSKMGDATTLLVLPLIAIVVLGSSPLEVGLIGAAQLAPAIVFGLPAGAWVDRLGRRRPVMVAADLGRALSLATIPVAYLLGVLTIGQLYLVAAVNATLAAFFDVASSALVPGLVGRANLVEANARLALGRSAAEVGGPAVGGSLIGLVGAPFAVLFDAMSFVASATGLSRIRLVEEGVTPAATAAAPRLRTAVVVGIRFVLGHPYVRAVVATAFIANLSRTIALTVLLIYAVRTMGLPAAQVGLAFAIGNLGFFVGAVTATRFTRRLTIGRAMVASVLCFGPGMTLVALAPGPWLLPAICGSAFLNTFGVATHGVNQISLRQSVTPPELLARVSAVTRLVITGALPAGATIGGALGSLIGLHETLLLGTFGLYLAAVPYLVSRVDRLRSLPTDEWPEAARRRAGEPN